MVVLRSRRPRVECVQAGVSHRSLTSEGDYSYVGLYPEVAYPTMVALLNTTDVSRGVLIGIIISVKQELKRPPQKPSALKAFLCQTVTQFTVKQVHCQRFGRTFCPPVQRELFLKKVTEKAPCTRVLFC